MPAPQKVIITFTILWLCVQGTMLGLFGIGHGGDTGRYLGAADGFLHGELPHGKSASYIGYDLFVTAFMASPLGEAGVVVGQLVLSALAAFLMYRLGNYLYSEYTGYLAALFYIGFLKLHPWNVYILTDSLCISLVIISSYYVLTARTKLQWAGATALILYTVSLRPDGVAIVLAAIVYALYCLYQHKQYALVAAGAVALVILLPLGWYGLGKVAADESLLEQYQLGAVIWNYPPLYQTMPGTLPAYVSEASPPLLAIIYFATAKPVFFISLALTKLWYEIIHVRPWYAPLHNFLIIVTLVPLYYLAYQGWRTLRKNPTARVYLGTLLFAKALIVSFTFADWSGRFLLHVLSIILLLAAGGLAPLVNAWLAKFPYGLPRRA